MSKRKAAGGGEPAAKKAKGTIKVDELVPSASAYSVVGDFNAKLNQTDIAGNHNKYYFIQLLSKGSQYFAWSRWGRVGDAKGHQVKLDGPHDLAKAEKAFRSKFKDKTRNDWDNRGSFKPAKGKYTLIDVDESSGAGSKTKAAPAAKPGKSKLNSELVEILKVIFDQDMFKKEMAKQNVDVSKLPLGNLTKAQVAKGNAVLSRLKTELEKSKPNSSAVMKISSDFYTLIPHNFGWKKPTPISTMDAFNQKVELVNTLNDIELAQRLQGKGSDPFMDAYERLGNKMEVVPPTAKEHKVISKYFDSTKSRSSGKLLKVFSLDRKGEKSRMSAHAKMTNRRLLWHGTSPAVVAAILHSGLRIMPHSGGRVGKGIYLASENSKSAGYTGSTKVLGQSAGFMFLVEGALGRMHSVHADGPPSRFKAAPSGSDSVKAEGRTETFDSKTDATISGAFGPVSVPQKKPQKTTWSKSSFSQSEYLVYKESQAQLRYMCVVKF